MKKEQLKKVTTESEDKRYERYVVKMQQLEDKRQKQLKDVARMHKQKAHHDKQKQDKITNNYLE